MQKQEFERLRSTRTIHGNVRLIAATHRDLGARIKLEKFREESFLSIQRLPD